MLFNMIHNHYSYESLIINIDYGNPMLPLLMEMLTNKKSTLAEATRSITFESWRFERAIHYTSATAALLCAKYGRLCPTPAHVIKDTEKPRQNNGAADTGAADTKSMEDVYPSPGDNGAGLRESLAGV